MRNVRWCLCVAVLLVTLHAASQSIQPDQQRSTGMTLPVASTGSAIRASSAAAVVKPAKKPPAGVTLTGDGLVFRSPDDKFVLKVNGLVQADSRSFSSNLQNRSTDVLLFRRVRPIFEGKIFGAIDYRFMPDFGQGIAVIQDAYIEPRTPKYLRPRVGKFKTPVGLELLQADANGMFVERSLVSTLLPNRDLGIQLGGDVLTSTISYAVGYFKGVPDGGNATFDFRDGNAAAARVFFKPFSRAKESPLQGFGIGVGGTAGHDNAGLARYKTTGQNTFFKYSSSAIGRGEHNRLSPQAYYYYGPFEALAEYALSSQAVGKAGRTVGRVKNQAWQASAGFVVTGEHASYNSFKPKRAFRPDKGWSNLGGFEVVARYSRLSIDERAFLLALADPAASAREARAWAVGFNWYLNRYVRLMTDYEHTKFRMFGGAAPLHSENVVMSRVQLAF